MTEQEKAKKLLPIIQAIAEGKKIQYSFNGVTWFDGDEDFELQVICNDIISGSIDYRIKPEENDEYELPEPFGEKHYRPFKDFNELMSITGTKLLWVIDKCCFNEFLITGNQNLAVYIVDRWYSMKELFDEYTFPDGSPIGMLEK